MCFAVVVLASPHSIRSLNYATLFFSFFFTVFFCCVVAVVVVLLAFSRPFSHPTRRLVRGVRYLRARRAVDFRFLSDADTDRCLRLVWLPRWRPKCNIGRPISD